MPVRQRCPQCQREFVGSDCIGRPCFSCEFGITYEVPDSIFGELIYHQEAWKCPEHPDAELTIQMIASDPGGIKEIRTCTICHKNSFLAY